MLLAACFDLLSHTVEDLLSHIVEDGGVFCRVCLFLFTVCLCGSVRFDALCTKLLFLLILLLLLLKKVENVFGRKKKDLRCHIEF